MALSGLFPKSWLNKDQPSTPSPSTSTPALTPSSSSGPVETIPPQPTDSSLSIFDSPFDDDLSPGRTPDGKFKLPPIALYVSGAAFAMTIGLTIMIVPMIRSSRRKTGDAPEFLALHFQQIRPKPGIRTISTPEKVMEGSIASDLAKKARGISIESQPKPAQTIPIPAPTSARWDQITEDDLASTSLLKWRRFNTKEEREIFGTSLADPKSLEDEEDDWGDKSPDFDSHAREGGEDEYDHTLDQMDKSGWMNRLAFSPLATFYAFAISTAFVGVSTGLGVWIVAKALGVEDINELRIRLREQLVERLPGLSAALEDAKKADEDSSESDEWRDFATTVLHEREHEGK